MAGNSNTDSTSPDIFGTVTANYCLIQRHHRHVFQHQFRQQYYGRGPAAWRPLADNGGPTQTMALLAGSPAINTGSSALIPSGVTTDQRGYARIFNGTVDIGAYESPNTTTLVVIGHHGRQ